MIFCACGTEAIAVWHDPDGEFVELAMWSMGARGQGKQIGWRQRLRGAWRWLRGEPYVDQVALTPAEVERLVGLLVQETTK